MASSQARQGVSDKARANKRTRFHFPSASAAALPSSLIHQIDDFKLSRQEKRLENADTLIHPKLTSPSCIRLLTIQPGDPTDPICCTLRSVDLKSHPRYVALSYTWKQGAATGSRILHKTFRATTPCDEEDETPRTIICNYQQFQVQPNLHKAMLQLRKSCPGDYWIDAICVDQSNPTEKSLQIPMMDQIYHSATSVLVWLGSCPECLVPGAREVRQYTQRAILSLPRRADEGEPTWVFTAAAAYLLTRPWFQRLWVVQEVCHSAEISFLFGETQFSSMHMERLLKDMRLCAKQMDTILGEDHFLFSHLESHLDMLSMRDRVRGGGRLSLEDWLKFIRGRKVTDPRDMIYGGMALLLDSDLLIQQGLQRDDCPPLPPRPVSTGPSRTPLRAPPRGPQFRLWPRISIRYHISFPELMLNVAACLLSTSQTLKALSVSSRPPNYRGDFYRLDPDSRTSPLELLASWVPNPHGSKNPLSMLWSETDFKACASLPCNPRISSNGKILSLEAAGLGTIKKHNYGKTYTLRIPWSPDFLDLLLTLPSYYIPSGCHIFEALARLLTLGKPDFAGEHTNDQECSTVTSAEEPSHSDSYTLRKSFCRLLEMNNGQVGTTKWYNDDLERRMIREEERHDEDVLALKQKYPEQPWPEKFMSGTAEGVRRMNSPMFRNWWSKSGGRQIHTTHEKGHLVLAPDWVEEGDAVMLVKGGSVPYIFRSARRWFGSQIKGYQEALDSHREGRNVFSAAMIDYERLEEEMEYTKRRMELEEQNGGGNRWILVGEAYVEGIMQGEACQELLDAGCFETIDIV